MLALHRKRSSGRNIGPGGFILRTLKSLVINAFETSLNVHVEYMRLAQKINGCL